jgi:hypothetical protein
MTDMKILGKLTFACATILAMWATGSDAQGIHAFKGGARIAAASCPSYIERPGARVSSVNGQLRVHDSNNPVKVRVVCALPLPEKAKLRQFVMVGNVSKGEIFAFIAQEAWNEPRSVPFFANISLLPSTPFEVPARQQKKIVKNVPTSGSESMTIDRINTYFIEAEIASTTPVDEANALELFYFEVYWD